jgi:hypothetical protein
MRFRSSIACVFSSLLLACSDASSTARDGGASDGPSSDAMVPDGTPSSCGLVIPDAYDGTSFAVNAAEELDVRARFNALLAPMKSAESNLAVRPTAEELEQLFDDGSPSLRSLTTPYYAGKIHGWLVAFAAAAGNEWTPSEPPSGPGGRYGGIPTGGTTAAYWIFSARGTDLRQAIEKGMFGAMQYARAHALMRQARTPADVDRVLALYGAHPDFPQSDKGGDGGVPNPDVWTAQYAKRRDDKSKPEPGLYRRIKEHFVRAQAAAKRGDCQADLDDALSDLRKDWEKTIFATVVFYLHDAIKKASVSSPTAGDLAAALHSYGELVAFVHGWRTLPPDSRTITDAQIDGLLASLGAPESGDSLAYTLVTDTAAMLARLQAAIATVGQIEGFSAAELEAFKVSY